MKREIAAGAAWMILMRVCDRLLGLASTLILARLLTPSDFGVVAMAMSFIALIELAGAFSFEIALIQRSNPTREHYDTAWTLNLCFSLLCAGMIVVLAPLAARFYAEPRLILLMCVLAVGWVLQGFENIGTVNFRRDMDFAREFRFMFRRRLIGFVVTLACAFALKSYWALVAGQTTMRLAGLLLSYLMHPYRPRFSLAAKRDLFSFSGWMLVTNVLGFGLARLPHFAVGRVEGSTALGVYTMASEFARLPSTEVSAPINRAVLPGLAKIKDQPDQLRQVFSQVMGITFAIALPSCIGLAVLAAPIVDTILGPTWTDVAPILAVLAVAGAIEVLSANTGIAYLVLGRARLIAGLNAAKLLLLVTMAIILVPTKGALGMALAELWAAVGTTIVSVGLMRRLLGVPLASLWRSTWRTLAASGVMAVCVHWIIGYGPNGHVSLAQMAAAIAAGGTTYVLCLVSLWAMAGRPSGAESLAIDRLRELLNRYREARAS